MYNFQTTKQDWYPFDSDIHSRWIVGTIIVKEQSLVADKELSSILEVQQVLITLHSKDQGHFEILHRASCEHGNEHSGSSKGRAFLD
jgi:hypothetical protein